MVYIENSDVYSIQTVNLTKFFKKRKYRGIFSFLKGKTRTKRSEHEKDVTLALDHSTIHQIIGTSFEFVVIYIVFGLGLRIEGILQVLIIFALMMFALYGFGILIASLCLILKEGWIISEALYSLLMILSPVAYPLVVLPSLARQVSSIFPTVPALVGMRSFLLENYTPEIVGNVFLHLLALDIAWMVFGVIIFHLTDVYTRKRGALGKY